MTTTTLDQNIPTELWGVHIVATNVVDGETAELRVTPPGEDVSVRPVSAGDTVDLGGITATVEQITGGGHDGPPGRSTGRVTLSRPDDTP